MAILQDKLPVVHIQHTMAHKSEWIHAKGKYVADLVLRTVVQTCKVATLTQSQSEINADIMVAVQATLKR